MSVQPRKKAKATKAERRRSMAERECSAICTACYRVTGVPTDDAVKAVLMLLRFQRSKIADVLGHTITAIELSDEEGGRR